jgi:hypothetical protein
MNRKSGAARSLSAQSFTEKQGEFPAGIRKYWVPMPQIVLVFGFRFWFKNYLREIEFSDSCATHPGARAC